MQCKVSCWYQPSNPTKYSLYANMIKSCICTYNLYVYIFIYIHICTIQSSVHWNHSYLGHFFAAAVRTFGLPMTPTSSPTSSSPPRTPRGEVCRRSWRPRGVLGKCRGGWVVYDILILIILYYIILNNIISYCILLYDIILYDILLYYTLKYMQ